MWRNLIRRIACWLLCLGPLHALGQMTNLGFKPRDMLLLLIDLVAKSED